MTMRQDTGRTTRWLLVAGLGFALVAQTALPALHAVATAEVDARWAPVWHATVGSGGPVLENGARPSPSHEPATCPVCQSLVRTNPLVLSPDPTFAIAREGDRALPEAPLRAWTGVAQIGHPSRAPPLRTLHLV